MKRSTLVALSVAVLALVSASGSVPFVHVKTFELDCRPWKVACGDLDGDGDIDIAVAAESSGSAILRNDGNGEFAEAVPASASGSAGR